MVKLIALLKRRADISRAAFVEHYETRHAPIIMKHFGTFVLEYRRTYLDYDDPLSYVGHHGENVKVGAAPFDVVTELVFADRAALDGMFRVAARPEVGAEIAADEEHFLDRSANQIVISNESNTTPGLAKPSRQP
jgi:hypothetical protein